MGRRGEDKEKFQQAQRESIQRTVEMGRWPPNLILDEEAASLLDEQTGTLSVTGKRSERSRNATVAGTKWGTDSHRSVEYPGDSGAASRFFYVAKPSKRERGEGNDHPCPKPIALMKYLLTLVATPTGGIVLDPFGGSGTTALAAKALGRRCILVEQDAHYCDIAARRLEASNN